VTTPANNRRKWRPSLIASCFFRSYQRATLPLFSLTPQGLPNQLIQQTEAELIAQSAALSRFPPRIRNRIPESVAHRTRFACRTKTIDEPYQPIWPALELASEACCPPRPEARAPRRIRSRLVASRARHDTDLIATQNVTLAGFRRSIRTAYHCWAATKSASSPRASRRSQPGAAVDAHAASARAHLRHDQPVAAIDEPGTGMRVFTRCRYRARSGRGFVDAFAHARNVFKYLYGGARN